MLRPVLIALFSIVTITSFAHKEKWDDNKKDWSELMVRIYNGQTEKSLKLTEAGVDLNSITPGVNSNWRLTALEVAIRKENEAAVSALLKSNRVENPKTYLMVAAGQKSRLNIEQLIQYGANPKDTTENGYSVLMMAASFGSFEVFDCLLRNGAPIEQTRKIDGITALMLAAFNGEPKKVKVLLDNGADKSRKDKNGNTALYYAGTIYEWKKVSEKTKTELRRLLM